MMFKKFRRKKKSDKLMKISIEVLEFPAEQNTKPFPILICKPIEIGNRKNILELVNTMLSCYLF